MALNRKQMIEETEEGVWYTLAYAIPLAFIGFVDRVVASQPAGRRLIARRCLTFGLFIE